MLLVCKVSIAKTQKNIFELAGSFSVFGVLNSYVNMNVLYRLVGEVDSEHMAMI